MENKLQQKDEEVGITFAQLLKSTIAAFIGVQSSKNRERDFKVSHFIAIGLLFGLLFIATLVTVVQIVMHFAAN